MTRNEELIYENETLARESEERMKEIRRLRKVIRGEEDRMNYEVMSFIYWLANFDQGWMENCFDGNLHLKSKFEAITRPVIEKTGCITPGAMLGFFYTLSYNHQSEMIKYVRRTYTGMESHKPKG